jgi:hypothetical protein
MLEAPRELYERALLPLKPEELPPKPPPDLDEPLEGMLRLPIRSELALGDLPLPLRLDALGDPDRLPAPALERSNDPPLSDPDRFPAPPAERFIDPALGDEPRVPPCRPACCCRALA